MRTLDGWNVEFFPLLWCQGCSLAAEPRRMGQRPELVADEVLRCSECREPLTLLECHVQGELRNRHYVATLAEVEGASR